MQNMYGQGYYGDEYHYTGAKEGWFQPEYPKILPKFTGSYQDYAIGGYSAGVGFNYVDGYGNGVNDALDESWGPRMDVGLLIPQYNSPFANGSKQATPWVSHPNNIKDFFRVGYSTNHSLSMTANTENSSTRVSVGYRKQEGVMPNTNLMHYTAGINSSMALNKYMDFSISLNYTRTESDNLPMTEYGSNNVMQSVGQWFGRQVDMNDLKAKWNTNNDNGMPYNWNSKYHNNPYWTMRNTNSLNKNRVFGKYSLFIKPTSYLKFEGRVGLDNWNSQTNLITRSRSNETMLGAINKFHGGSFYLNTYNNTELNLDGIGTFDKKFGSLGVTLMVGTNYRNFRYTYNQVGASELTVPDLFTISNVSGAPTTLVDNSWIRSNSFYTSATLSYLNWVYLDASFRKDWSSTIKKPISYPSVSLSILPLEFIKGPEWLSFLKLRGNWAKIGTATTAYQTDPYYYASTSTIFGVTQYSATTQSPPIGLVPEMVRTQELGVEARFLNNRIGLDVAYYNKKTTDQILSVAVSKATGYNSMLINAGEISNKGWEVQLNGVPFQSKTGFNWSVNVQAKPGEPWGVIVGTGMSRDNNGNIVVGDDGLPKLKASQILGNVNPDWMGSISNEFTYKGISFGFLLDYRKGGDVFSVSQMFGSYSGLLEYTAQGSFREKGLVLGRDFLKEHTFVKSDGKVNDIVVGAQEFFESYWSNRELSVFDGSFLKLREIHLSYDIPQRLISKIGLVNRASISVVGTNVALLWLSDDNKAKIDPECTVSSGNSGVGLETTSAPQTRSFGFKLSLSF